MPRQAPAPPRTYCEFVQSQPEGSVHRHYHDHEYGFPLHSDNALFGRLLLEINQAGLSWATILKKKDNFFCAYAGFDIASIAAYEQADIDRLLSDTGIIRNRLKVQAAIFNARQVLRLQQTHGSFGNWLLGHHPLKIQQWVKLFKKHFKFMGGEIVNEFLMSTGFLPGAHHPACPVYPQIEQLNPPWRQLD